MIIDCHTHLYDEKTYQEYLKKSKNKIKKIITIPWFNNQNKFFKDLPATLEFIKNKDNIFALGVIDIEKNLDQQLANLDQLFKAKKIVGIKLYPGYQYFYPWDKFSKPIAKLARKYNKPLVFHSGDVFALENSALLRYTQPRKLDELAVNFPDVKIVVSHFGFPFLLETGILVSKNPNIYTEISGTIECLKNTKEIKEVTSQYIEDLKRVLRYCPNIKAKIMFGTDFCGSKSVLSLVEPYVNTIKQIMGISDQANSFFMLAEKLYFNN